MPIFLRFLSEQGWFNDRKKRIGIAEMARIFVYESFIYGRTINSFWFEEMSKRLLIYLPLPFNVFIESVAEQSPIISKKGQEFALRSMKIQDYIVGAHQWNIEMSIQWLKSNLNKDDIPVVVSSIFTASMNTHYEQNIIIGLVTELTNNINVLEYKKLPELITEHIFIALRRVDPYPRMTGPLYLLFLLKNNNLISSESIVNQIKAYYDFTQCKSSACLPFCWFAPEIQTLQPEIYTNILTILKNRSTDDFFHEAYKNYIKNLDEYQKDNWKFYKEKLPKNESLDPIISAIRKDDPLALGKMVNGLRLTDIQKTEPEVFDPCSYASEPLTIAAYSCIYGSVKVFHSLKLSRALFMDDKITRKLPLYATVGHSVSTAAFFEDKADITGVLQAAALSHSALTLDYFLRRGMDPNEIDRSGRLPLTCAAASDFVYGTLRLLLAGAAVGGREAFGWTALHMAAERGSLTVLRVLLEVRGVDPNATDIWGMTPLHVAVDRGQEAACRALLACPAVDPNLPAEGGRTPAHTAARGPSLAILRLLKGRGADLSARTAKGRTLLHFAAEMGSADIVKYLLTKRYVKRDAKDAKGRTAKDLAEKRGDPAIIKSLLAKSGR